MNVQALEDSDSSDEDYVPEKKVENTSSELDSDEDTVPNEEPCKKKRKKNSSKCEEKFKNIDEKKQKDDDVWADFMKDTGFKPRSEYINNRTTKSLPSSDNECKNTAREESVPNKVTITEVFNFAGENIIVEKEVKRRPEVEGIKQISTARNTKNQVNESKGHSSGIGGIVSQLGKKTKISTLEKSKLDWDQFKKQENLDEELQTFNRGKDGYLEKQDFLNRADLRRFEIEREMRTIERNNRTLKKSN